MRRPINWLVVALSLAFLFSGTRVDPPVRPVVHEIIEVQPLAGMALEPFHLPQTEEQFRYVTLEEAERLSAPAAF